MWFSLPEGYCHFMLRVFKGTFTSRLFSTRLASVIEAGKFGQPIGRLSESTNRQPELSSLGQQSRANIFRYKNTLKIWYVVHTIESS